MKGVNRNAVGLRRIADFGAGRLYLIYFVSLDLVLFRSLLVRKCVNIYVWYYNWRSQEKNLTFLCLITNIFVWTEIFRRYLNKIYTYLGRGCVSLGNYLPPLWENTESKCPRAFRILTMKLQFSLSPHTEYQLLNNSAPVPTSKMLSTTAQRKPKNRHWYAYMHSLFAGKENLSVYMNY
jgi:hypothetical protein